MNNKQQVINLILRILSISTAVILIAVAFGVFTNVSNQQLNERNKVFLESYSREKINSLELILNEGLYSTESMADFYGTMMATPRLLQEALELIQKESNFREVRYIDRNGKSIGRNGKSYYVKGEDFFINGMEGKSGISYVLDSPSGGGREIIYYAPIVYLNRTVGVLATSYDTGKFEETLNGEIYGYPAACLLLNDEMDIIVSSGNVSNDMMNIKDDYTRIHLRQDQKDNFERIFSAKEPELVEAKIGGMKTIVYVSTIQPTGWMYIQEFPKEAIFNMEAETGTVGFQLMAKLVLTCVLYIVAVIVYHYIRFRVTLEESKKNAYISKGTGRVFSRFLLVDFETGLYEYIYTNPTDDKIPKTGTFQVILDYFDRIIIGEEMKKSFRETFRPDRIRERLENDDRVYSYNLHVQNPTEYWDTISVTAVEWDAGHVTKALITNQHVTQMKQKEERDQAALKAALVNAQEANKAKSVFLSNMSHDIRTPMNAIVGFATLLDKDAENPEKVREYSQKITASSEHLLGLINDVLDMSKIESGKIVLNLEVFNINNAIEELDDIIIPQMESKGKKFVVNVHDIKDANLKGDKVRINQILLNLLSNAMKYTDKDAEIIFEIFQQGTRQDKKYAIYKFIVKDNGIGMDEDFKEHIFESFTREISSVTNKIQGTGLGMAITKNLVDIMGGSITVESTKGEGSCFEVTIPFEIIQEQIENKPQTDEVNCEEVLKGMKFMVVEDNEINYMVISSLLEMNGATAIRAENGKEAVEIFTKSCKDDFDMIFMDVQMPVMNGYEATRYIRSLDNDWAEKVPIIAMTANAFAEDVANALNAGMDAHVAKPINMEALASTVNNLKNKK